MIDSMLHCKLAPVSAAVMVRGLIDPHMTFALTLERLDVKIPFHFGIRTSFQPEGKLDLGPVRIGPWSNSLIAPKAL